MISRREVVTAGVLGTLATANPSEGAQSSSDVQALKEGFKSLEDKVGDLKASLEQGLRGNSMNYGHVGAVKDKISRFARLSGKFPDFCDIGIDVFYDVYDWHVRQQQQINIVRMSDQRIAIQFMFTQLLLRWENEPNYIGTPY
jgi:hypothetical protein